MEPLDHVTAKKLSASLTSKTAPNKLKLYARPESTIPRDLEGRLRWYVQMAREKSTRPSHRDVADYSITIKLISSIEEATGISYNELRNTGKRDVLFSMTRSIFAFIERRLNKRSHTQIGAILNSDQSSCHHMMDRFRDDFEKKKLFQLIMKNNELKTLFNKARRTKK